METDLGNAVEKTSSGDTSTRSTMFKMAIIVLPFYQTTLQTESISYAAGTCLKRKGFSTRC